MNQINDKYTGLVSYLLLENNKILVDQNRKSKYKRGYYPYFSGGLLNGKKRIT